MLNWLSKFRKTSAGEMTLPANTEQGSVVNSDRYGKGKVTEFVPQGSITVTFQAGEEVIYNWSDEHDLYVEEVKGMGKGIKPGYFEQWTKDIQDPEKMKQQFEQLEKSKQLYRK